MTTFLFAAGIRNTAPEAFLDSAASVTKRLMPSLGVAMTESRTMLAEIQGGWTLLSPADEQPAVLFSSIVDERRAVLVFGDVHKRPGQTAAQAVREAWASGGVAAVRRCPGSFGAVLIERTTREITLLTDIIGHRYLRYYANDEALLVSPHDLFITATGRCPLAVDRQAVVSILGLDWSFGARSLLEGLETCRSTAIVRWAQGRLARQNEPLLNPSERVVPQDRRAAAAQLERILTAMREGAKRFVNDHPQVEADLTAGADTRAVLALLLSVTDGARIHAVCHGEEESLDVRTARRLAGHAQVRFSSRLPQQPSPETFFAHCDLRAFYMNGDTSGKRAYHPLPVYTPNAVPRACGRGGSTVKVFYRAIAQNKRRPVASFEDAFGFLSSQACGRLRRLPWTEPKASEEAFLTGLRQACESYAREPMSGEDLFDLFYLYERHGVWESMIHRLPWLARYWSPFADTQVIRLGFALPAPDRAAARVHQLLVRRYLPAGCWMRINQDELFALEGDGRMRRQLRQAFRALCAGYRGFKGRLTGAKEEKSIEQLCAEAFAGNLAGPISELLQAENGLARSLFGKEPLQALLEQHRRGERNFVEAIGSLLTMERWWALIRRSQNA